MLNPGVYARAIEEPVASGMEIEFRDWPCRMFSDAVRVGLESTPEIA